jgi:hypothetical protein
MERKGISLESFYSMNTSQTDITASEKWKTQFLQLLCVEAVYLHALFNNQGLNKENGNN